VSDLHVQEVDATEWPEPVAPIPGDQPLPGLERDLDEFFDITVPPIKDDA
jgi:hypothetical protein